MSVIVYQSATLFKCMLSSVASVCAHHMLMSGGLW